MFSFHDNAKSNKTNDPEKRAQVWTQGVPSVAELNGNPEQTSSPCQVPVSVSLKWENITTNRSAMDPLLIFSEVDN